MNPRDVLPSSMELKFHDTNPVLDDIYRQRYVGGMIQEMLSRRYWRESLTKQTLAYWAEKVVDSEKYPQYRGYFSGDEWEIAVVLKDVYTQSGPAFYFGDVTLVKKSFQPSYSETAFSFRNAVSTAI